MKKTLIFLTLIAFCKCLTAQNDSWRLQFGRKKVNTIAPKVPYYLISDDSYYEIQKVNSLAANYVAVLYSKSFKKYGAWTVGLNYSEKGFSELGTLHDADSPVFFNQTFKRNIKYLGCVLGGQYHFYKKNKWQISLEHLLNGEVMADGYPNLKQFSIGFVSSLNIKRHFNNHWGISLNPFCELPIGYFNKKNKDFLSNSAVNTTRFIPYSYGVMLELFLKK